MDCSSLEVVYDMKWINVKGVVSATQLSKLVLYSLPNLKHIWNKDPYGILTFEAETAPRFVFPIMTSLRLMNLQQFKSFYPGTHTSEWPLLKKLEVRDYDRVKIFACKFPTFQEIHMESDVGITIQ